MLSTHDRRKHSTHARTVDKLVRVRLLLVLLDLLRGSAQRLVGHLDARQFRLLWRRPPLKRFELLLGDNVRLM